MKPVPRIEDPAADAELQALRRGDRGVLQRTLSELLPDVRRWLHRLLGPGPSIDDATQDVLLALAKAFRRHEGRCTLRTLAYRITVRHAYRAIERHNKERDRQVSLELVPPPPDQIDPESRAMHREALARLYRCLGRLPRQRRTAFVLCAIEGLSASEAAALEGTSATTMRSRLMHARRDVGRRLSKDPYVARLLGEEASS